ncbi:hypothetical protein Mal52_51320 [Symmachiella dynata]|uniref:Uncharacterized protein n=1 Tax=Symmachiella dynata TaxID=2527995 RepID=A0A517ZVV9_9PLAN|nr:hypothetical protein [Symmachiella dynata]QDU46610.1 hypothetical protein Mal52_51320 [Symmachiella dynata]
MSIVSNTKEIVDLIRKLDNQELYQKICDLRDEIFDIREQNLELREELKRLKEAEDISNELKRDGNVYIRKTTDGTESGPFCMACWDYDRKLVNVRKNNHGGLVFLICNICEARKGKTS